VAEKLSGFFCLWPADLVWDDENKDLTPLLAGPNERNQ